MPPWMQPVVKSMILCEDVLPGPAGTENVHLMNVFSAVRFTSAGGFPFRLRQLCVFLQLTDAEGEAVGQIVARHLDSGKEIFGTSRHNIRFEDRLQVKWVLFRLSDCPFPEFGVYSIEFHCDEQWLADVTVAAVG